MTRKTLTYRFMTLLGLIFALAVCPGFAGRMQDRAASVATYSSAAHASLVGESTTLLADGRQLIAGGQQSDGQIRSAAVIRDPATGVTSPLQRALNFARAGHTATVLPDGTVLILGGIGMDGHVVSQAELFDPESETFRLLSGAPTPRAFHTATLLTDGRLFIAGGVSSTGRILKTTELWDFRQRNTIRSSVQLVTSRFDHQAMLLADGRVLLSGGKYEKLRSSEGAEIYDPQSQTIAVVDPAQVMTASDAVAEVRATSPEDNASGIPTDALISMRFSRALLVESINQTSIVLSGPEGMVQAKVIGAEGGMLAFLSPGTPLVPGTTYTVTISGLADASRAPVAFIRFTFTTAGEAAETDSWIPSSGWLTDRPDSEWRKLPPLKAVPGVTALAGQVLKLDGRPLPYVTLQIDDHNVLSDETGRFLFVDIAAGHHTMMILGNTANRRNRSYGIYEVGVDVKAAQTNVLDYTIWMTPLDTAHAVSIPSPTTAETTIKSPLLPGLELHIPANTVITGYDGRVVTKISITPIAINKPPFPLPAGVQVPIYFTIQPGSAYIKVMAANGPKGARLFYPNTYHNVPGTQFNFWNYSADGEGWYVYGHGRVSADTSQVIPDPGVVLYEFSGAMVADPGVAPPNGPGPDGGQCQDPDTCQPDPREPPRNDGDPVDLGSGLFVYTVTDLTLSDVIPITLRRTYRPGDSRLRAFGIGTNDTYDMFMVGSNLSTGGYVWQDLILPDGSRVHFQRISPCDPTTGGCAIDTAVYQASTPGAFFGAVVKRTPGPGPGGSAWELTKKDGTVYYFLESDFFAGSDYRAAAPVAMIDRYGNSLTFTRTTGSVYSNLLQITSQNGRWIRFTYDSSNRITQAQDNINRTVQYAYDAGGRLSQVIDANGGITRYTYDAFNQMLTIQDARGIVYLTSQYDGNGRVAKQTMADNTTFQFAYTTDPTTGQISQTDVTDQRGNVSRTTFNAAGYVTGRMTALGRPEQQTITYVRDPQTNLITGIIDGLGRETDFTSDAQGNILSITTLAKTPAATVTQLTYEPNFSQLTSVTDPLNHVTTLQRDPSNGNLTAIIDALGHQTTFTYNPDGQGKTITDALQNTVQFGYDSGDLVSITDPMLNASSMFTDGAGRLISRTDPLGNTTELAYNALNEITQITDPKGGITTFSYDPNGNLLTVQDPNQQGTAVQTAYAYDNMDRVVTRTDPLMRQENYAYDQAGKLIRFTDRRGKVATLTYDALGRMTFAGFGTASTFESTISYVYDTANRVTQITDVNGGRTENIYRTYDDQARIFSRRSALGTVSYAFDAARRRSSMSASGQPAISYSYDDANRLTQISQGSVSTLLGYDIANRRTGLTLSNGIEATYCYDNASRLTGLFYNSSTATSCSNGSGTLGSLTYTYDAVGRRIQMGGTLARTGLPQPVSSAIYDTANELILWNGVPLIYDAAGNLVNDSVNTYVWNARGQLAAMGANTYLYDAGGHRTRNQAGTGFLYDSANAIQELTGVTPTATRVMGGIDEFFSRSDSTGTYTPIIDALGSVLALSDSNGNIVTQYTYDPFGSTSVSGATNSNTAQYTGRENDGNGLYYYRARYYDPAINRFVSEDPLRLAAGNNFYAYVGDSPINLRDPFGLYGTNDCSYYQLRCEQSGGDYYCETSPAWCNWFPKPPDPNPDAPADHFEGWSRCTRQCLQDCDKEQYENSRKQMSGRKPQFPDPSTDGFWDWKPFSCHAKCYTQCAVERFGDDCETVGSALCGP